MAPLTKEEALRFRSRVSMMLANLGEFQLFWLPGRRKLMARSVCCTRRFVIPSDAILVGTYASAPGATASALEDLAEVIETLPEPPPVDLPMIEKTPPARVEPRQATQTSEDGGRVRRHWDSHWIFAK